MHSRVFCSSSLSRMPSRPASRRSSSLPPPGWSFTTAMFTETTSEDRLRTSGTPVLSVIMPRTGGTMIFLTWSCRARLTYDAPARTCRYQTRPASTASSEAMITCSAIRRRRATGVIVHPRRGRCRARSPGGWPPGPRPAAAAATC